MLEQPFIIPNKIYHIHYHGEDHKVKVDYIDWYEDDDVITFTDYSDPHYLIQDKMFKSQFIECLIDEYEIKDGVLFTK